MAEQLILPLVQRAPCYANLIGQSLRAGWARAEGNHRRLLGFGRQLPRSTDHACALRVKLLQPRGQQRPAGIAQRLDGRRDTPAILEVIPDSAFLVRVGELRRPFVAGAKFPALLGWSILNWRQQCWRQLAPTWQL